MLKYTFKEVGDNCDSVFICIENFLDKNDQLKLIYYFNAMNDFQPCTNYKKEITRYQKWYQEEKKYFCSTWKYHYNRWDSFEYDDVISKIQNKVQAKVNTLKLPTPNGRVNFNSCLVNKYTSGNDYICSHQDSRDSFGEYPVIVGISVGSTRKINFKKVLYNPEKPKSVKTDRENPVKFSFELKSGSMFIMAGASQKYFVHEIPKTKENKLATRYSMTFRQYIS
jgi:alkylated DNA repair dioxygenase AlkB